MKFLLAPDSYKGSLSAKEVAKCMELGIKSEMPSAEIFKLPVSDGGEGTVENIVTSNNGFIHHAKVSGPLGDKVHAKFGTINEGNTAVVEVAETSGLALVAKEDRNPSLATSYGLGELLNIVLDMGCKEIIIGLGGSATNDGGMGMAQALGAEFYDKEGRLLSQGGKELIKINKIDIKNLDKRLSKTKIVIASDVGNHLCGKEGASFIFGKQKGATTHMISELDNGMRNYARKIKEYLNKEILHIPGSGAAGGLGGGLIAFTSAEIKRGIDLVLDYTNFKHVLSKADFVFTGEGRTDSQTIYGKVPVGVANQAKVFNKPVICISGSTSINNKELQNEGLDVIMGIVQSPTDLTNAIRNTRENIQYTVAQVIKLLLMNGKMENSV